MDAKENVMVMLRGCERPFPLNDRKKMDEDLTAINQFKCASRYGNTIEKLQVTERYVTNESIVFIKIRNDPDLWDKLFSLAEQLYREDKPCCPTHTNMEIKDLFPKLQQFITQNTTFICELPCIKSETIIGISCHKDFPFSDSPELNICTNM